MIIRCISIWYCILINTAERIELNLLGFRLSGKIFGENVSYLTMFCRVTLIKPTQWFLKLEFYSVLLVLFPLKQANNNTLNPTRHC